MLGLASYNKCTGCSACINICPMKCLIMKADEYGFLYPSLQHPNLCVKCGMCGKVCPVSSNKKKCEKEETTKAYAVYSKDVSLREASTSGGAFAELALEILKNGGAVYGAAYDNQFYISHIYIEKVEDLNWLCGAKYAQSDLGYSFREIKEKLELGQQILFVGTPCQVAGLKAFLQKDFEGLYTVDFVCHGVPSPAIWKNYVEYRAKIDNAGQLPKKINLRSKHTGWSHYQYSNVYQYYNGVTYSAKGGTDLYMRLFVGDYINRNSCAKCRFKGYNRISDITLGDFWGIWDIAPEMDDNRGTSLVLVHSEKGENLVSALNDRIQCKKVVLEQAATQNSSLLYSSRAKLQRDEVFCAALSGDFEAVENILKTSRQKTIFLKRMLEKIRRIIKR